MTLSVAEPLATSWFERWRCYSMRPDECICQPMESMILGPKPGIPVLRDGSNCRMLYEDDRPVALLHLLRNDGPDEGTCIVEYRSRCWDYLSTATRTEPPRWPRMSATNPRTRTPLPLRWSYLSVNRPGTLVKKMDAHLDVPDAGIDGRCLEEFATRMDLPNASAPVLA